MKTVWDYARAAGRAVNGFILARPRTAAVLALLIGRASTWVF